ncbi:MAG: hypothetical protein HWD60_00115 [Defluviicoccus sp.]|nr:MAG: hypothetical protein HWD60_00115 [Defluviicoccus sp.]
MRLDQTICSAVTRSSVSRRLNAASAVESRHSISPMARASISALSMRRNALQVGETAGSSSVSLP